MAGIIVSGDTSGAVTLQAPAVAGTVTVTLPATTGTMLTTASTTGVSGNAISAGTVAEAYGGTGTTTGYYGFKNRIINGAMVIDQRNAGAVQTSPASNAYGLDRWKVNVGGGGFNIQQNAGAVTPPADFSFYYGVTSTGTTTASNFNVRQLIEGFNFADFGFGTANAQSVTLSFWVRSSLTGTFGGAIQNDVGTRSYVFSYTISSANTWQQVTATVPGDTSGTWIGATTGAGAILYISYGTASANAGAAGSWTANDYRTVTGQTNVLGTNGATFYITGVQLEKGSTATSFDYRPYGTELALCQRYFSKLSAASGYAYVAFGSCVYTGAGQANGFVKYPTTMRSSPTISYGGNISFGRGITLVNITGVGTTYVGTDSALWQPSGLTGGSDGSAGVILSNNDTTAFISFSSEL